jgi:hypothetical protein
MCDDKPKIFCYIPGVEGAWKPDKPVCALSEDGDLLAVHVSSNESFAKSDIGVTNPGSHHHEAYRAHYPDGYELVWVEGSIRDHPQGGPALDRNHDKYPEKERVQG